MGARQTSGGRERAQRFRRIESSYVSLVKPGCWSCGGRAVLIDIEQWSAELQSHHLPRDSHLDLRVTACHHSLDLLQRLVLGLGHHVLREEECQHAEPPEGDEHPRGQQHALERRLC